MAVITTYPDDPTTSDDDKFLTSDSSGATKLTSGATLKSYVLSAASIPTSAYADGSVTPAKRGGGFYAGSFVWTTGAGSIVVTGLGFKPKMIQFFAQDAPTNSSARSFTGFAISPGMQFATGMYAGNATNPYRLSSSSTACVLYLSGAVSTAQLQLTSMDSGGFTLLKDGYTGTPTIGYMAYA